MKLVFKVINRLTGHSRGHSYFYIGDDRTTHSLHTVVTKKGGFRVKLPGLNPTQPKLAARPQQISPFVTFFPSFPKVGIAPFPPYT